MPYEQYSIGCSKDKNQKQDQKVGNKLQYSFLIMTKILIIFRVIIFGLAYKCLKWKKFIEISTFNGYRENLMFIVNAKNAFGAWLGQKFINLEPDSV